MEKDALKRRGQTIAWRSLTVLGCLVLCARLGDSYATRGEQPGRSPTSCTSPPVAQLVKKQVLLDGDLQMYPAFFDINADSKIDMLVGTKGHEYAKGEQPTIRRQFATGHDGRQQLSFHLNQSDTGQPSFSEPYWLNERVETAVLPYG